MRDAILLGLLLTLSACSGSGTEDGGLGDAGPADGGPGRVDAAAPADAGGLDAASPADAGSDAGVTAPDAGPPDAGAPCGAERPDVSGIRGTEGLVIARDGTLYYSTGSSVGRLRPGEAPEDAWSLVMGMRVWGLTLDATNETLFAGVPGSGVYAVDVATARSTRIVSGGSPNGLAIGADGALYYSDFGGDAVYRVLPDGSDRALVTASPIAAANGVAFEADGALLVASYATGVLLRLRLTDGVETDRATVATGLGSPDGVALDALGRIYVTDNSGGTLTRLDADGSRPLVLATRISAAAAIEFGAGALDCEDVYVASSGALVRHDGDSRGASVPWH